MTDAPSRIPRSRQKEAPRGAYRWIGRSMKRVEDPRLLTGHGTYADDIHLPGMAHAAVLRSPHAHARIKSIDTSRAKALSGVILVMTGAEAANKAGPLPCFANPPVKQMCTWTECAMLASRWRPWSRRVATSRRMRSS